MIITYVLEIYGTDKIIGLGLAGNLLLICQAIVNNLEKSENINIDWYSLGNCIVYDKLYSIDTQVINPFEYYFIQKYKNSNNNKRRPFYKVCKNLLYAKSNSLNSDLYKLCKKKFYENFKLKKEIQDEVDDFYNKNLKNKNVLGIQVRLTDMVYYHNVPGIKYFINKTFDILKSKKIDTIFIASDSEFTINKFKQVFPNINIYYQKNIMRSVKEKDCVQPQDRINYENNIFNNRKYHNYLNGKEVLMDILLLSKCDYFLRSHSSVSDTAIILNENIKEIFV